MGIIILSLIFLILTANFTIKHYSVIEKIINDGHDQNFEDETQMDWDATAAMGILSELKQCREDLQRNPSCSTIPMAFENIHVNRYDPFHWKMEFSQIKE